jgi:predicted dehydrogenase
MNEHKPIRVGVVGAGFFGRYHAQQYSLLPGATLVGIADHDAASAARLAAEFGGEAFDDHRRLAGLVDAVSVATPTVSHYAVAEAFLKRGVSVLVEKPMAATIDEARSLVRLADQSRAVLQVGHVERFNPTWKAFEESPFRPTFIETRRSSQYPFRSLDVSVVFDVMIHDIDLALAAAGAPVSSVDAMGSRCASPSCDKAEAFLTFANGCRAHLSVSRVHHATERTMRLSNDVESLDLDFVARKSAHCRMKAGFSLRQPVKTPGSPEERERRVAEMFETQVTQHDTGIQPLNAELASFIDCVRRRVTPKVGGEQGLEALAVAQQIEQRIEFSRHTLKAA